MSRKDPQIHVRIPHDLKTKLEESAKLAKRSLNAEVSKRLLSTFVDSNKGYGYDEDDYERDIFEAQQSIKQREEDLDKLPPDVDPIERAIFRYELRKAEHYLECLENDLEDFRNRETLYREIYYPNEEDEEP